MDNKEFQKTVLESFTRIEDKLINSDERNIKLFEKLNEKIDFSYENMMEGFQMFTEQFSHINNRLDRNDRLEKRLEALERQVKKLQDKLIH